MVGFRPISTPWSTARQTDHGTRSIRTVRSPHVRSSGASPAGGPGQVSDPPGLCLRVDSENTMSFTLASRRGRFFATPGSKVPARPRDSSIVTGPVVVSTVFARVPLGLLLVHHRSREWDLYLRWAVISNHNVVDSSLLIRVRCLAFASAIILKYTTW